jgi:hypothetical protein
MWPFSRARPPGLGRERVVDAFVVQSRRDEPVPLDRRQLGDGLCGLGDLLVDPVQRPPISLVAVVDDLVAPLVFRAGWPALGEDAPVRDLLARVLAPDCTRT